MNHQATAGLPETAKRPLLEIAHLTAGYGQQTVLRDVSLTVECGELVGLVGPNGAGKSTLLRVATGGLPLNSGSVRLMGAEVSGLPRQQIALRAAVLPQNSELPETFTAWEIVLMGRYPHLGWLRAEGPQDLAAARAAMLATSCWQHAKRRISELSGGERQAVLLARALAQESPLLLLDEPTAHLDIGHQADILSLVLDLCRKGTHGALAVIHDLTLAAQFCRRLIIMDQGRIVADGAPGDLLTKERVDAIYRARTDVFPHPLTGRPIVVPAAPTDQDGGL